MANHKSDIYICCIWSWYHRLGFIAYLMAHQVDAKAIYLVSKSFMGVARQTEVSVFNQFSKQVQVFQNEQELVAFLSKSNVGRETAKVVSSAWRPFRIYRAVKQFFDVVDVIRIEEGIGTYGGWLQAVRAEVRQSKSRHASIVVVFKILSDLIAWIYLLPAHKSSWLQFDRRSLVVHTRVVDSYYRAIDLLDPAACVQRAKSVSLLLTSPFVELGVLSKADFIDGLNAVVTNVDSKWFLKPHPIEDVSKYVGLNVELIDKSIPAEMVFAKLQRNALIFGFSSTSLYNASQMFGLTAYRLANLDEFYRLLDKKQRKLIDTHAQPLFSLTQLPVAEENKI